MFLYYRIYQSNFLEFEIFSIANPNTSFKFTKPIGYRLFDNDERIIENKNSITDLVFTPAPTSFKSFKVELNGNGLTGDQINFIKISFEVVEPNNENMIYKIIFPKNFEGDSKDLFTNLICLAMLDEMNLPQDNPSKTIRFPCEYSNRSLKIYEVLDSLEPKCFFRISFFFISSFLVLV